MPTRAGRGGCIAGSSPFQSTRTLSAARRRRIPSALRPVFRDRDDFTAGNALTEQTLAALDAAQALIVICSPSAAKSRYVNEEIRQFKSRYPQAGR
jgi:TIR domain